MRISNPPGFWHRSRGGVEDDGPAQTRTSQPLFEPNRRGGEVALRLDERSRRLDYLRPFVVDAADAGSSRADLGPGRRGRAGPPLTWVELIYERVRCVAVTIQFLGPLAVVAGSRRPRDRRWVCVGGGARSCS